LGGEQHHWVIHRNDRQPVSECAHAGTDPECVRRPRPWRHLHSIRPGSPLTGRGGIVFLTPPVIVTVAEDGPPPWPDESRFSRRACPGLRNRRHSASSRAAPRLGGAHAKGLNSSFRRHTQRKQREIREPGRRAAVPDFGSSRKDRHEQRLYPASPLEYDNSHTGTRTSTRPPNARPWACFTAAGPALETTPSLQLKRAGTGEHGAHQDNKKGPREPPATRADNTRDPSCGIGRGAICLTHVESRASLRPYNTGLRKTLWALYVRFNLGRIFVRNAPFCAGSWPTGSS
jgi:hypothetical protein